MVARLTRAGLYDLVWDRPMTKLATEFGLSDVALHKICRKHDVPTPLQGHWAKKAHGKPLTVTPLPAKTTASDAIVIHGGAVAVETEAMAVARANAQAAPVADATAKVTPLSHPIVDRTIAKLAGTKADKAGFVKIRGPALVSCHVTAASVERASQLLRSLTEPALAADISLKAGEVAAKWVFDDETVSCEIVELADKVEHVATEAELKAVEKWEAEREATFRKYGYRSDCGRPRIPKWEDQYNGRLSIRLEEVRIRTENQYWGPKVEGNFSDTRRRDLRTILPKVGDMLGRSDHSMAQLEATRRELGAQVFSAQYQQNPVTPEGNLIRLEWFGTYDDEQPERSWFKKVVQSWDTAMSSSPTADYSVCLTWGWCDHEWYLLDVKRERLEYPDIKRAVIAQQRAWRADKVLIEYANAGLSLWQEMKVDGPFLPSLIKPKGDKAERLTGKTAQLEEGRFLLPREAPWLAAFQSELRAFPFGRHDDQVDAMTQFLEFELERWRWVETDYDERGRPQQIIRRSRRRG